MRQKNVKMAICAVTAILTFSGMNIEANAATDLASVLPSAGVDYTLQANATSLKNIKEESPRFRRLSPFGFSECPDPRSQRRWPPTSPLPL